MGWSLTAVLGGIGLFFLIMTYGALYSSHKTGKYVSGVPCVGGFFILIAFLLSPIKWLAFLALLDYGFWMIGASIIGIGGKRAPQTKTKYYDPNVEKPIVKSSICTGEKTAGFKDLTTGKYRDVMAIKSDADLQQFMKDYGLETIDTEY